MSDRYDFANLSPIEFEGLCVDLVSAETGLRFERFSEGADGGVDGRHSKVNGDIILQAKHYKNSTWSDLKKAVKNERCNIANLKPSEYYLLTSQPLTPARKRTLVSLLDHPSVVESNIWGRAEINACLGKHSNVERSNIKLWLSSAAVLDRLIKNDIAVFTEATHDEIERVLKVFVVNPSLKKSAEILRATHCLIVSGPPGVGKTTLAQVLAAEYSDDGWELVSIASVQDGFRAFQRDNRQVFIFDDFLGKIRLEPASLVQVDSNIVRFMSLIRKDKRKRFILTTRAYILQAARALSEALDDETIEVSELGLNLATYTRELKARILYNHIYHSEIDQASIQALLTGDTVRQIVDHRNYMPRIIQWMTDEFRQQGISPEEYPAVFLKTLENPSKIWDKAFKHHISIKAQILLYCMYFSEQEWFSKPGIRLDKLQAFFERAIIEFGAINKDSLRASMFSDTLREIKSSFVVIDESKVNFINPSVQDYLSTEIADATVLSTLGRSVPTLAAAVVLWKRTPSKLSRKIRAEVAGSIMKSIIGDQIDGRIGLHDLADLVGDLVLATETPSYCQKLREQSIERLFWVDEVKLPVLIMALSEGKFSHLPHAKAYARYLRIKLSRYLSSGREYIELEDLATLAASLISAGLEMPEQFYSNFDQAVEETVETLDVRAIGRTEDPEQTLSEWLDHIETIESLKSIPASKWKKRELEERIIEIQQEDDYKRQWEQDDRSEPRSLALSRHSHSGEHFSDTDLRSMFSSLKN